MPKALLILGLVVLFGLLCTRFPYALDSENSRLRLAYLAMFLVLCSGGIVAQAKRRGLSKVARDAIVWLLLILALVDGYSFRDDIMNSALVAELMPQRLRVNADGSMEVRASQDGSFYIEARVNGEPVRFAVDTGASDIVLSPADARRAGIAPETLGYTRNYATANGIGRGAAVVIGRLEVGPITLQNVPASVNQAPMEESLLGMAFLRRLHGFRVIGSRLLLNP
jgi:aspartyl protease family protein